MVHKNPIFSDDLIQLRWKEYMRLFATFKPAYEAVNGGEITLGIDPVVLLQTTVSYFHDVARYKMWHFPEDPKGEKARIDDVKKSAFIVHWMNKLRPIYTERVGPLDVERMKSDTSLLVNGQFGICITFDYLDYCFSEEMCNRLLYMLNYRTSDPHVLIILFETINEIKHMEEMSKKKSSK